MREREREREGEIIQWSKLFNDKSFKYNVLSNNLKNITSYNLAKIIYPDLTRKNFYKIINFIIKNIKIKKKDTLLDFGSGNGAFLNFFKNKVKKLYSLEISKNFINFQKKYLTKTKYILTNPTNVDFFKKVGENKIDILISCSVFHYFYNNNYCLNILKEMIRITRRQIFIFDIKDENKKNKFINNLRKRQNLTKKKLYNKYKYTPQRFYNKLFFTSFLKNNYPELKFKIINLPKEATDSDFGFCLKIEK
jgi:ubiquinone/menaquinone biosynthesis C-methylase UbiE